MAAETVEGSCKENLAGKLWTHCGRLRAGGPSGGRAELSRAGGHGLGLAITRRILALHHLSCRAESTKTGVRFTVSAQ